MGDFESERDREAVGVGRNRGDKERADRQHVNSEEAAVSEKNKEEGLQNEQGDETEGWEQTNRRKEKAPSTNKTKIVSFFVYNISDAAKEEDLRKAFEHHGNVVDVYIARKRDKYKKRFGFIKFNSSLQIPLLLQSLQNTTCHDMVLSITLAKYDRYGKPLNDFANYSENITKEFPNGFQHRGGSRKSVSANNTLPQFQDFNHLNFNQHHPQTSNSYRDALFHGLPKSTNHSTPIQNIILQPKPFLDFQSWNKTSLIITAKDLVSLQDFYNFFLANKPSNSTGVKFVGGMSILLTFSSPTGALEFLQTHKEEYTQSFKKFELIDDFMEDYGRIAPIRIYGVPLRFWDKEVFDTIGKSIGEIIEPSKASINDQNLQFDSMIVMVKSAAKIDRCISVSWKNILFNVRITEDGNEWYPDFWKKESNKKDDEYLDQTSTVHGQRDSPQNSPEFAHSMTTDSVQPKESEVTALGNFQQPWEAHLPKDQSHGDREAQSTEKINEHYLGSVEIASGINETPLLPQHLVIEKEQHLMGAVDIAVGINVAPNVGAVEIAAGAVEIAFNETHSSSQTLVIETEQHLMGSNVNVLCNIFQPSKFQKTEREAMLIDREDYNIDASEKLNISKNKESAQELRSDIIPHTSITELIEGNTEGIHEANKGPGLNNHFSKLVQQNYSVFRDIFQVSRKPEQSSTVYSKRRKSRKNVGLEQRSNEIGYYTDEEDYVYDAYYDGTAYCV